MKIIANFLLRIERFLGRIFERPLEDYGRLPKWIRYGIPVLLIGGYVTLFTVAVSWESIRRYRSDALLEKARTALEGEDIMTAFNTARASLQVDHSNDAPVEFIYELLRDGGASQAFVWGNEVGKRLGYSDDLLLDLARIGLRHNLIFDLRPILLHLRERNPTNTDVRIASARIHLNDRQPTRALAEIQEILAAEPENVAAHELALIAGLQTRDIEFLAELQPRWREFTSREDALGLVATRNLLRLNLSDPELLEQLESHPLATRDDRVLVTNIQISNQTDDVDELLNNLATHFDFENPQDRTQWVLILALHNLNGRIIRFVEDPTAEESGRIAWEYLLALIAEERADEAVEILSQFTRRDLNLSETQFSYLRTAAESEVAGDFSPYTLTSVLRDSSPSDWALIERDLQKRGVDEGLLVFHEHMSRSFEAPEVGNAYLLLRAYEAGDEIEVRLILRDRRLADFARAPGTTAWFAAYLRLVLDIRVEDLNQEIQEIIPITGRFPLYRNLIALMYARMGQPQAARAVITRIEQRIEDIPAFLLMTSAILENRLLRTASDLRLLDYIDLRLRLETEKKLLDSIRRSSERALSGAPGSSDSETPPPDTAPPAAPAQTNPVDASGAEPTTTSPASAQ